MSISGPCIPLLLIAHFGGFEKFSFCSPSPRHSSISLWDFDHHDRRLTAPRESSNPVLGRALGEMINQAISIPSAYSTPHTWTSRLTLGPLGRIILLKHRSALRWQHYQLHQSRLVTVFFVPLYSPRRPASWMSTTWTRND